MHTPPLLFNKCIPILLICILICHNSWFHCNSSLTYFLSVKGSSDQSDIPPHSQYRPERSSNTSQPHLLHEKHRFTNNSLTFCRRSTTSFIVSDFLFLLYPNSTHILFTVFITISCSSSVKDGNSGKLIIFPYNFSAFLQ